MSRARFHHALPRTSAAVGALALAFVASASLLLSAPPASAAPSTAPAITLQPQDQTAVEFTDVTFVAASDDPAATVLWSVSLDDGASWIPYPSDDPAGTQTSLTVEALSARESWLYHAVFTNDNGSTATAAALITVTPAPPVVDLQPADTTVVAGTLAGFYARAWTLNHDHTMQWQVDTGSGTFVDLVADNTTQESLQLVVAYADSGNRYRALFTSAGGTTASDPATLTVTPSVPTVMGNPQDQDGLAGSVMTFTAGADGDPLPTVQWQRADRTGAFTDVPGATSLTLTVTALVADDFDRFRAVFTNGAGTATSSAATLRVWLGPFLDSTSTDQTVTEGTPATFTLQTSGNPAPEVQWQVSTDENGTWTDIPGATQQSYTTPATTLAMSGRYYHALVSSYGGAFITDYSVLTVIPAEATTTLTAPAGPTIPTIPADLPTGPATRLPVTGADSLTSATTGAALVGLGGLLVLAGRRRRTG